MISAFFGVLWTEWGASGVPGAASGAVRIAGLVVGFVIFVWSAGQWRAARRERGAVPMAPPLEGPGSMFSSRAFLLVAAVEVAATWLVAATGHPDYVIVWVAAVVGAHFLAFGRLFWAGFYWLGTALIAAGIAGATVGLAGGGPSCIKATVGLMAAATLFVAGGWSVVSARASVHV